ncbi:MAG TPA: hypothetical protein VFA07_16700 [Chthonomonadaceae bacterium]|nr:hypothetical protein [Chthonomonadaceae bacterium]
MESAGPPEAREGTAEPNLSDTWQLSRLINATLNRSLRDLLGTLVPQTGPDAHACVATKGTVQHIAGPDTVYVLDYEVHIHYRCVTPHSSTEGTTD